MRTSDRGPLYQDLDRLFRDGAASVGDGALLAEFSRGGDEAAFEALVRRHGPMVRGVCRRLLPCPHDADDAFQATFLVLARGGGRLRDPDRLAGWLHGVASRVAAKARARASRLKTEALVDVPAREDRSGEWSDLAAVVDDELARMSVKHREVLVVCLLEGATAEEASRRLSCPIGTVKSRLARAREALRARLTSRGVAPGAAVAVVKSAEAFPFPLPFASPVPSTLIRATLATVASETVAPGVAAIAEGAASVMIMKSAAVVVAVVGLGLAGLGATAWLRPTLAQDQPLQTPPKAEAPAPAPARPRRPPQSPTDVTTRNLKETLLAAHNYHSQNGAFPTSSADKDGKPLLSWRVAILPLLGQEELYRKFHLDEPWDGPNNKPLIDQMPAVFETPHAPAPRGQTRIRGFAGHRAVFESGGFVIDGGVARPPAEKPGETTKPKGVDIREITDGASNTVFVAIAKQPVSWTFPEGMATPFHGYEALDGSDPRGYLLAMCDGSIRWLPQELDHFLPALITRNGGEVVSPAVLSAAVGSASASGSSSSSPSSVEKRLGAIEEKLDRLLEKLDAK